MLVEADSVHFQMCSDGVETFLSGTSLVHGVPAVGPDPGGRLKSGFASSSTPASHRHAHCFHEETPHGKGFSFITSGASQAQLGGAFPCTVTSRDGGTSHYRDDTW